MKERDFQMSHSDFLLPILKVLMPLRCPNSLLASGGEMYQHTFDLLYVENIFRRLDGDVALAAQRDLKALKDAGFLVEIGQSFVDPLNASVAREGQGQTKLQWVNAASWNFFAPVWDPVFGCRLHMADLAVNKALATGGRRQVRDYVDLFLIHKFIAPLWIALWAAPGKDESWSPRSLAEKIAMKGAFCQEEFDEEFGSESEMSATLIGTTIRDALNEADSVFQHLPNQTVGKLFVTADGGLINDIGTLKAKPQGMRALAATKGGTWPSGPGIDHALIQRVISAYGCESGKKRPGYDPRGHLLDHDVLA